MARTAEKEAIGLISLGVVAYNEQDALPQLLADICAQDIPHHQVEVVLVDSASTDGTRRCMEEFAVKNTRLTQAEGFGFARVQVLDNPARIQAAGWNVVLRNFSGDALVRVDAHASLSIDFLSANVAVLNEGEDVCGGMRPTMIEPGQVTPWHQVLHLAEESAFGSSVADYRRACEPRYVKSLFHAAYRREVLDTVGTFNEKLLRTEDNDFHYRVGQAGYRIKLDPRINSKQFIRSSLGRMLKQKYGNGHWIGRTLFIQPACLQLYHFAPFILVAGALILALFGLAVSWKPFLLCAALYALLCIALSVYAVMQSNQKNALMIALPLVFAGIHLSYGVGTITGLVKGLFSRGKG